MRRVNGSNSVRMDVAFTRSAAFADMTAALALVGCESYTQMLDADRDTRDRFHAEWTRLMQVRCGISVIALTPALQAAADSQTDNRRAVAELHAEGYTDRMVVEALGISRAHAANLRNELGLPPNGPQQRNKELVPKIQALVAAANSRISSATIAKRLGVSDSTVTHLRRKHPLGVVGFGRPKPETDQQRAEALRLFTDDKLSYAVIAARLGIAKATALRWVRMARVRAAGQRIGQILTTQRQRAA